MISGSANNTKQTDAIRESNKQRQRVVRANRSLTIELGNIIKENFRPEHNTLLINEANSLKAEADLWHSKSLFLSQVLERAKYKTSRNGALVSTLDSNIPSVAVLESLASQACSSSSHSHMARKK